MLDIRAASAADAPEVAAIYVAAWNEGFGHLLGRRGDPDDELVTRWAHDLGRNHWWVASREGTVVGVAGVSFRRDRPTSSNSAGTSATSAAGDGSGRARGR